MIFSYWIKCASEWNAEYEWMRFEFVPMKSREDFKQICYNRWNLDSLLHFSNKELTKNGSQSGNQRQNWSAIRVMASLSWDSLSIMFIDFLKKVRSSLDSIMPSYWILCRNKTTIVILFPDLSTIPYKDVVIWRQTTAIMFLLILSNI